MLMNRPDIIVVQQKHPAVHQLKGNGSTKEALKPENIKRMDR
jgi:hypothetical protein